jgi:hypothetical protein
MGKEKKEEKFRIYFKEKTGISYKEFLEVEEFEEYIKNNDWFYFTKIIYEHKHF